MNPAITVIICMYKGEATVCRMIDCVLNQTFKDFELILVDDGSPDRCGEIADEYSKKDNRVRVLHKPNGGLADARNHALDIARGEYTIQFDQDDWVEPDCLEGMYAKAKRQDADMLICDNYRDDGNRQLYGSQKPSQLDSQSILKDVIDGKIYGYCWNKLIRLDVYKKYNIKFPIEFYGCEDQYGMCKILKHDIKIVHLENAYYHYVTYPDSLSRHYDENTYQNDLLMRDMFVNLLKDTSYYDSVKRRKTMHIIGRAFMFGKKHFSSLEFVNSFRQYESLVMEETNSKLYHFFYWLSFRGHYQMAITLYSWLFEFKQCIKRI